MARGKGNRIFNVPSARFKAGQESMIAIAVVPPNGKLRVGSGKRPHRRPASRELEHYAGTRGQRGRKLPRGFQSVSSLSVEP